MNAIRPIVGQWYRGVTNELFEVVAIDDQDETIEIQYFDGTVTEMEFDAWNEQLFDRMLDAADAPEDWSGAIDVETEDLDREFEDNARTAWSSPKIDRCAADIVARRAARPNASRSPLARREFVERRAQYHQQDQPGTALKQVITKKFGQPTTGTKAPRSRR
jgi:hypothetical protein